MLNWLRTLPGLLRRPVSLWGLGAVLVATGALSSAFSGALTSRMGVWFQESPCAVSYRLREQIITETGAPRRGVRIDARRTGSVTPTWLIIDHAGDPIEEVRRILADEPDRPVTATRPAVCSFVDGQLCEHLALPRWLDLRAFCQEESNTRSCFSSVPLPGEFYPSGQLVSYFVTLGNHAPSTDRLALAQGPKDAQDAPPPDCAITRQFLPFWAADLLILLPIVAVIALLGLMSAAFASLKERAARAPAPPPPDWMDP
jgi:hypothetical protein